MKKFDHEKLNVYNASIKFVSWSTDVLEDVPKQSAVHNQLDRASISVPLNKETESTHPKTGADFSTMPEAQR